MTSVRWFIIVGVVVIAASIWLLSISTNDPYEPEAALSDTYFTAYYTPPTKLDPASCYFSHEGYVVDKIVEAPFGYHFLKRPYKLIPRTAVEVPEPVYFDENDNRLPRRASVEEVARAKYTVHIKKDVMYQSHPCFATDDDGKPLYRDLTPEDVEDFETPNDFPRKGTRELTATDYALQVRRLADPRLASPIFSALQRYIAGLDDLQEEYSRMLEAERRRRRDLEEGEAEGPVRIDYMEPDFPGVEVLGTHTYKMVLKRKYPQILYWMAMHFFCPTPQEALDFYGQQPLIDKQIVLNRWPVGTGAYYLGKFQPNRIITLEHNENYRFDTYPTEGEEGDKARGLLDDAGKQIPFVERMVMIFEKEPISRWNKFLQGYYDAQIVTAEVFEQTINLSPAGEPTLSQEMEDRGIEMVSSVGTSIDYFGFNMLDDVVGGYTPEKRKLRQAISIALDYNEYMEIFLNGRGVPATSPIPPGVPGYISGEEGINPYVDEWDPNRQRPVRKPIEVARQLMVEAGYPEGRCEDGRPLVLHLDHSQGGRPEFRTELAWFKRKLALLGIDLRERPSDLSRLREKIESGNWQLHRMGWLADYPDAENFLFLLYGPNSKVSSGGENAANYANPEYDKLFRRMESMEDSPERLEIIDEMVDIARRDAPWVFGYHRVGYILHHEWYHNDKQHHMSYDALKYIRIDPQLRARRQAEWNKPRIWPVVIGLCLLFGLLLPAVIMHQRRERGR